MPRSLLWFGQVARVHLGNANLRLWKGRPNRQASVTREPDSVHRPSVDTTFDDQDGVGEASLDAVALDEVVTLCMLSGCVFADKRAASFDDLLCKFAIG